MVASTARGAAVSHGQLKRKQRKKKPTNWITDEARDETSGRNESSMSLKHGRRVAWRRAPLVTSTGRHWHYTDILTFPCRF